MIHLLQIIRSVCHRVPLLQSMAPSQVSGPKMRNLLFVVVLGLLAVVHSAPVNTETQDDIYEDAITEEFLIKPQFRTSVTTQAPKRISTQQPSTEPKESDMIEGSASGEDKLSRVLPQHGGKQLTTTTLSMHSYTQSSTSKVLRRHTGDSSASNAALSIADFMYSDSGSGNDKIEEENIQHDARSFNSEMSTSTSTAAHVRLNNPQMFDENEGSGSEPIIEEAVITETVQEQQVKENVKSALPQENTAHRTSSWFIIVGFIAGVAALVMICIAIATRDKWNGPKQAPQLETTSSSSNQQMGQEMETFLHKEKPRENGRAAEYTVIPLDELPEKCAAQ